MFLVSVKSPGKRVREWAIREMKEECDLKPGEGGNMPIGRGIEQKESRKLFPNEEYNMALQITEKRHHLFHKIRGERWYSIFYLL